VSISGKQSAVPSGEARGLSSGWRDHIDIRISNGILRISRANFDYQYVALRTVLQMVAIRVTGFEFRSISGAQDFLTIIGHEHDLTLNDINELIGVGVPMALT